MGRVLSVLKSSAAQSVFQRHNVSVVYLFGSHREGRETTHSDVDLAVLFGTSGTAMDRFRAATVLELELRPLLREPLEIVALDDAGPLLAYEAAIRGKPVYARDDDGRVLYQLQVLHRYEDYCHIQGFYIRALRKKLGLTRAQS